jgi:tetratricopeptide (TPR) repeat protein
MTADALTFNPLQLAKARLVCAALVFLTSLALYTWTLAPTVTLVDSGELITAVNSLGVAHPPGFPIYVLLAHIVSLFPVGSVAVRVNFASALFAALAASLLTLVVAEMMLAEARARSQWKTPKKTGRDRKAKKPVLKPGPDAAAETSRYYAWATALAPCLVAGLLFAFSRTVWAYATIAEVYTLNALLMLVIFFLMFRWRRKPIESATEQAEPGGRARLGRRYEMLYAAAFVFGLALGAHHATIGVSLPALAALVYFTEGPKFFTSKRLLYAAMFAMAGLSVYAYLPLAALRSPVMNWGDPRTLERLWWHVTGRQYRIFLSPSLDTMAGQLGAFFNLAARELNIWWLPAGLTLVIAGFVALFRRDPKTFWFLSLVIIGDLAYALNYEIAEDKDAYYLPTFIAMAVASGAGADWLLRSARSTRVPGYVARFVALGLIVIVPLTAFASNLPYNNRSHYYVAQDYVENILSTIEPNGMLLTLDWQVYSPLLYLREIEGRRTDVVVIDINQLRRSWYFDYLKRAFPDTMRKSSDKVEAFLEDLRGWEADEKLYDRDIALNKRITARFYDMILSLVSNHIQSAPVYITEDVATNQQGQDRELTESLSSTYGTFIPQGLVFQLSTGRQFQEPARPQLVTRGLFDGTIKFEDDDVVAIKVRPVYLRMLVNRGRYLAASGRHEEAIEAYKEALALDPGFKYAQQSLNESANALRGGEANKTR